MSHSRDEVLAVMDGAEVAAIATAAGDKMRNRMMHCAVDENFNVYLASMKGDPKTVQMTNHPSVAILVFKPEENINDSAEVELTGKAFIVRDEAEREKGLEIAARKSPVVRYLRETGNSGLLDCIKVAPETVKYRVFKEIVQGMPPTVLEFPQNRRVVSDWSLLKRKMASWYAEVRAPFLTAAAVPVFLGTAMAWLATGSIAWGYFVAALIAGVFMQIGTNIANDYFDHVSGNDEANTEFVRPFTGGSRMIQIGLLTPLEVLTESLLFFGAATAIGIFLAVAVGWPLWVLGAFGLITGFFYVGKPFNFGARGFGELIVGLDFGVLMTAGAYFVQTGSFAWAPVVAGIPVGLLIAAVLYINEFQDYSADKAVSKRTLVVRLGKEKALWGYLAIVAGTYVTIVAGWATGILPATTLLGLLTLPFMVQAVLHAFKNYGNSFDLAPANALTVTGHLVTGLLLTIAYAWEKSGSGGLGYIIPMAAVTGAIAVYLYRKTEQQRRAGKGVKSVAAT